MWAGRAPASREGLPRCSANPYSSFYSDAVHPWSLLSLLPVPMVLCTFSELPQRPGLTEAEKHSHLGNRH